jgi:hypothetical protein
MDLGAWKRTNNRKRLLERLKHPWPIYKRQGGISAVVTRGNGKVEDFGTVSDIYAKRWGTGSGR